MKTVTEQGQVTIFCDIEMGLAYIREHLASEIEGSAEIESADAFVAQINRDKVLGNKTELDPQEVFDRVSPYFRVVFDRKTFLNPLVKAVATNAEGFTERNPARMVEMIGKFIDYPLEKIAHRVALQLMSNLDPQNRRISGTYAGGVPCLHEARISISIPRTDESFEEEAVRFRFCSQHLEDIEKRALNWRVAVFTKLIDLRGVHFDHGNEHAVTIEEVVDELKVISKVYAHSDDFAAGLKRIITDCLTNEDRDRLVSLLEPLQIPGLKSNRPDAGPVVDQTRDTGDDLSRGVVR